MRWHTLSVTCLVLAISAAVPLFGQQAPAGGDPAADPRAVLQQIRDNMNNAGVTPQDIVQSARQQMQDGTFNTQNFMQQLNDQGIIDQGMITQLQNQNQNRTQQARVNNIKLQLAATDEEWAILGPKIQKILDLTAELAQGTQAANGRAGGMAALATAGQPQATPSPVAVALNELRAVLANESAPNSDVHAKLANLRDAKEKVKGDLVVAQKDLTSLVTLRQESVLLTLAILE